MAQVKKFQQGGTLTINGKTYTIDQINEYINQGGFDPQQRAALAGTINAIASGRSRTLDRNANSVSGEGVEGDFVDFYGGNEKRADKNTAGKTVKWSNRQARRNSDFHIANTAIQKLGGIEDFFNNKKEEKAVEKIYLQKGRDDDGFYTNNGEFLEGPENLQNIARINAILDAMDSGDMTKYDLKDWNNDLTLSGLTDWYAAQKGAFDRNAFFGRLRGNSLKDVDWEVLTKMGFSRNPVTSVPTTTQSHSDWKGDADSATRSGVYFTKNTDGTWNINGNTDYLNSTWYGGGLDFLTGTEFEGGGIHNGRLYTRAQILNNDPALKGAFQPMYNAIGSKDWRSWYDAMNASGIRFVGDRISRGAGSDNYGIFNTQFNPTTHYNQYWSKYFNDLGLGNRNFDVADMTSAYSNAGDRQIIAYVDPNNTYDDLGIRNVKYVVRNADGTYTPYDSEAALANAGFVSKPSHMISPGTIRRDLWETIGTKRYAFAYDLNTQDDQSNVIMIGKDGKFYVARKDPSGKHLNPKLIKNEVLLKQMLENPNNYRNKDIQNLYKNATSATPASAAAAAKPGAPKIVVTNEGEVTYNGRTISEKNGGVIPKIKPLPVKFQYGGNISKTTTKTEDNSTEGKRTDITSTHKINGADGGLTSAEKWQIAAAIGDLAGVGLSFGKGTSSWLGAGLGLGSTGIRFVSDIKKDGFQMKDLGNALGGAALDVASVVSTGAAIGKAVKTLRAVAEPITKALALAGAVKGVEAMGKVIRGEEITSKDLTDIISGLGSMAITGKNIKDTVGKAKLAKDIEIKTLSGKSAITKPTAEIGGKKMEIEVDALKDKTMEQVEEMLKKKVKTELGDKFKEGVHDVDLLDKFKIKSDTSRDFSIRNLFKKGKKAITSTTTPTFTPTEAPTPHSTLRYMISPRLRSQQLGYDLGYFGQKSGNLDVISKGELSQAVEAVKSGKATLAQQELVKLSGRNPGAFKFEFAEDQPQNFNRGFGWPIVGRRPLYTSTYETPTVSERLLLPAPEIATEIPKWNMRTPFAIPQSPIAVRGELVPTGSKFQMVRSAPQSIIRHRFMHPRRPSQFMAAENARIAQERMRENALRMLYNSMDQTNRGLPRFAQRIDDEVVGQLPMDYILNGQEMMPFRMLAFKKGGKVTKHRKTSTLPSWKYSDLTDEEKIAYKTGMEEARANGTDFIFKDYNFGKINNKAVPTEPQVSIPTSLQKTIDSVSEQNKTNADKTIASWTTTPVDFTEEELRSLGINSIDALLDHGYDVNKTLNDYYDRKAKSILGTPQGTPQGNPVGSGSKKGWGLAAMNVVGDVAGSIGKALSAWDASKQQMDIVNDLKPFQEQGVQKHSFKYRDPGIDQTYDDAIAQYGAYARTFKSASPEWNTAVGLDTASNSAKLELERGLKKAQLFDEQRGTHENLLREESIEETARVNRNLERERQMDAYKGQMEGSYIAQNEGIAQGLINDVQNQFTQLGAAKKALQKFDAQNRYVDDMNALRSEFASLKDDKGLVNGMDEQTWLSTIKKNELRGLQRNYIQTLYTKKGGKIRPVNEQIKIDNEKARYKAISQLSKQAVEFLKLALS